MPIEAKPRLNLPTLTVLSAASKAALPVCRTSSARDRVVLEPELADVLLRVDDVLDQLVGGVPAVGGEEDVAVRALDVGAAAEDRDHAGDVAVADVVLAAVGGEAAVAVRRQDHVGGVDVGAVLLLGEAEREDRAVLEQLGGAASRGRVVALPDRAEPEDRDLPRVPVGEAVEAGDLVEGADARGVPALVRVAAASAAGVSSVAKMRSRLTNSRKSAYQVRSWSCSLSVALPRDSKKSIVASSARRVASSKSAGS